MPDPITLPIDHFFEALSQIPGNWKIHSNGQIRMQDPYAYPICALANARGLKNPLLTPAGNTTHFSLNHQAAARLLGLNPETAELIAIAADNSTPRDHTLNGKTAQLRQRLFDTLDLQ